VLNISNRNVTFALNTIDSVAGQTEFLEIRKRDVRLRPLVLIDTLTKQYQEDALESEAKFRQKIDAEKSKIQTDSETKVKNAEKELAAIDPVKNPADYEAKKFSNDLLKGSEERKAQADKKKLENQFVKEQAALKRQLNKQVVSYQKFYQWMAVLVPPILPLIVAFFVFFTRLSRETEGVGRSRLR
jgi:ABC-2 type transport system permease protein